MCMTEEQILDELKGKTIVYVRRGDCGCSNYTLFFTFSDNTHLNLEHRPGGVMYPRNFKTNRTCSICNPPAKE